MKPPSPKTEQTWQKGIMDVLFRHRMNVIGTGPIMLTEEGMERIRQDDSYYAEKINTFLASQISQAKKEEWDAIKIKIINHADTVDWDTRALQNVLDIIDYLASLTDDKEKV